MWLIHTAFKGESDGGEVETTWDREEKEDQQVMISGKALVSAWSCRELHSLKDVSVSSLEAKDLNIHYHAPVTHWLKTSPWGNSQAFQAPWKGSLRMVLWREEQRLGLKLAKLGVGNPGPRSRDLRPSGWVTESVHYIGHHTDSPRWASAILPHRTAPHSLMHSTNYVLSTSYVPGTVGDTVLIGLMKPSGEETDNKQ